MLTNPSVVVEVLSRSTEGARLRRQVEGVPASPSLEDYLLVSQEAVRVEHFQREVDGSWRYRQLEGGDRVVLRSGAVVALDALYEGAFDLAADGGNEARDLQQGRRDLRPRRAAGYATLDVEAAPLRRRTSSATLRPDVHLAARSLGPPAGRAASRARTATASLSGAGEVPEGKTHLELRTFLYQLSVRPRAPSTAWAPTNSSTGNASKPAPLPDHPTHS